MKKSEIRKLLEDKGVSQEQIREALEAMDTKWRLEPGLYEVTEDFDNPCVDRRHRNDWRRQPIIKAGTKVRVTALPERIFDDVEMVLRASAHGEGGWSHQDVMLDDCGSFAKLGMFLMTKLRRVEKTMASVLADRDLVPNRGSRGWLKELLAFLIGTGTLTLAELESAADDFLKFREEETDEEGHDFAAAFNEMMTKAGLDYE